MNKKRHFGFIEMIGSVILLLIDPNRRDNKKYFKPDYLKTNRIVGIITISILLLIGLFYLIKYFNPPPLSCALVALTVSLINKR